MKTTRTIKPSMTNGFSYHTITPLSEKVSDGCGLCGVRRNDNIAEVGKTFSYCFKRSVCFEHLPTFVVEGDEVVVPVFIYENGR